MRFTLLLHYPDATGDLSEEQLAAGREAFDNYARALDEAEALIAAEIFQPASASAQVGAPLDATGSPAGIFVLDVHDRAAALALAEKCPAALWGTIEIRPTATFWKDGRWVASP